MSKPGSSPSPAGDGVSHNPRQPRQQDTAGHDAELVKAMRGTRLLKNLPKAPPLAGAFEPPSQPGTKSKRTPLQIEALQSPTSLGSGALTRSLPSRSSSGNQAATSPTQVLVGQRSGINSLMHTCPPAGALGPDPRLLFWSLAFACGWRLLGRGRRFNTML